MTIPRISSNGESQSRFRLRDRITAVLGVAIRCGTVALAMGLVLIGCETKEPTIETPPSALEDLSGFDLQALRNRGKLRADWDELEQYAIATTYLEEVVKRNPDDFDDRLNLIRVLLFEADRFPEAGEHITRAEQLLTDDISADGRGAFFFCAGLFHKRSGDHVRALDYLESATAALPQHVQAWYQRGDNADKADKVEQAIAACRKVLELDPNFQPAIYRLGLSLRRSGHIDEARVQLDRSKKLLDENKNKSWETEKCDLTRVTRRPYDRAAREPAAVAFQWQQQPLGAIPINDLLGVIPFDDDNDGSPEFLLHNADTVGILRQGEWIPVRQGLSAISNVGCADFDNDVREELVIVHSGKLEVLQYVETEATPQWERVALFPVERQTAEVQGLLLFDSDHDGDLDIHTGLDRFRNSGDLKEGELRFSPTRSPFRGKLLGFGDAHDLDQANDLDFVFPVEHEGRRELTAFLNLRDLEGPYRALPLTGQVCGRWTLCSDFDNDGAPDIFSATADGVCQFAFNADRAGNPYLLRLREQRLRLDLGVAVHDVCRADIDNDTDLDLLFATDAGVKVLRNHQGGQFSIDDTPITTSASRCVTVADVDGDCVLEVLTIDAEGRAHLFTSHPSPQYTGWNFRPFGVKDNESARGTVVEHFCGELYQNAMIRGPMGLHLGCGATDRNNIDGIKARWPQGIIQTLLREELTVEPACDARIKQRDAKAESCPFLYVRNEEGWSFVSDVIGLAPLDEWAPPGVQLPFFAEEFVRVPQGALTPIAGRLQLAITEELKETTYLDRVEVVAVDYDPRLRVLNDESSQVEEYASLKLFLFDPDDIEPVVNLGGVGMTLPPGSDDQVREADKRFLHAYGNAPSQWRGWGPRSGVEFDAPSGTQLLLLTGRLDWYSSSVVYAIHEPGHSWGPIQLERVSADGTLQQVVDSIGFLAGFDRTMVVTLPTVDSSTSSSGTGIQRLRLSAQHRLLWDQIEAVTAYETVTLDSPRGSRVLQQVRPEISPTLNYQTLTVATAQLTPHGFSGISGDESRREHDYIYAAAQPDDPFAKPVGSATRYGDVTGLMQFHDDLVAVLVPGDKVVLEFAAPAAAPKGYQRDYYVRISGWAKEASFQNSTGNDIGPLPYRAMKQYPPRTPRTDSVYQDYLRTYHTRLVQQ